MNNESSESAELSEFARGVGLPDSPLSLDLHIGWVGEAPDRPQVLAQIEQLAAFRSYAAADLAGRELAAMLLGVQSSITSVQLDLIGQGETLRVTRERGDRKIEREEAVFGHVDILLENDEAGLYLLQVDPGAEIPRHHHEKMRELEWHVAGRLLRDDDELLGMAAVQWPKGRVHGYRNIGERVATLFCCDSPAFLPSDEIYEVPLDGARTASDSGVSR